VTLLRIGGPQQHGYCGCDVDWNLSRHALVSDFDGTITQTDFFTLLVERYLPAHAPDFLEEWRTGKRTHFDAMQGYFDYAPADEHALEQLMRDTNPDPDLKTAVGRLADVGWDVIVVSAGCSWYIERILIGVPAVIHASPGSIDPNGGLKMRLPVESPFFSPTHGIDKAAVMRDAVARYARVAFAGDGPPDLDSILMTSPDLRFARGWLANELARRGERFRPFQRWSEVATALLH
jgi:2-hydroxy-3-keto-5-methylthiopentenyl-1-phosphate phosphatase